MVEYRGRADGDGWRVCVIVSQFNVMVTERLLAGAVEALAARGVAEDAIDLVFVPGAWELTPAAARAVRLGYDAIVALGCVIRGETAHFDYICRSVTDGLTQLNLSHSTPISFGVLTTDTLPQALARAGGEVGNLGAQAAEAALEMCDLLGRLGGGPGSG